jgi:hypothetical protein
VAHRPESSELLEVRASKSRPTHDQVRATTLDPHDEAVQVFVGNLLVPSKGEHLHAPD